jgi:hypothetical protein
MLKRITKVTNHNQGKFSLSVSSTIIKVTSSPYDSESTLVRKLDVEGSSRSVDLSDSESEE